MGKHWLHQFHFTQNERRGVQALLFLTALLFALPTASKYFFKKGATDYSALESQLALIEPAEEGEETSEIGEKTAFVFDPNSATFDDFVALGISERLSNRIMNYRDKGGKFFDADDFAKIYGLPPAEFQRLRPFIQIEGKQKPFAQKQKPWAKTQKREIQLSKFDPNSATFEQFCILGLPERTAHSIINYREKGGTFRYKKDFQKIYTLEKSDFQRLYAYIDLPEGQVAQASIGPMTYSTEIAKPETDKEAGINAIDINKATVEEWQKLRGIGPYFAKKIVGYREKLGGFNSAEQVAETYSLPDSTFQAIRGFLKTSAVVQKLNINTANEQILLAHPYFSKKQAKLIVAYREQHGTYQSVEDLLNIKILDKDWLEKVRPYLRI